jgi:hypothetical protein
MFNSLVPTSKKIHRIAFGSRSLFTMLKERSAVYAWNQLKPMKGLCE